MADHSSNKKFKSTFTTHQGAPVWVLEEIDPSEPEKQAFKDEKLDDIVDQLLSSEQPGASIQWDDSSRPPKWKLCPSQDQKLPDKIIVTVEEKVGKLTNLPPIKYFTPEGEPVYYFADPVTGHKYWDECDCDDCYNDCLENNDGLTPQQLKEQYAWEEAIKKKEDEKTRSAANPGSPIPP